MSDNNYFISKTSDEQANIVRKMKQQITGNRKYLSDVVIGDNKFDIIDFTFVDKHRPIVYNVEVIIPQVDYYDYVYDIAASRTMECMSAADRNIFDNADSLIAFDGVKFSSLINKTYIEYVEELEKDLWKDKSIFSEFQNTVKEYIKFDVEDEEAIGINCMFNYKYIDDTAINEIIDKLQKHIDDHKLVFNSSTKDEFLEGKHNWIGDVIPTSSITFDVNWKEINGISLFNEIDLD